VIGRLRALFAVVVYLFSVFLKALLPYEGSYV